MPALTQLCPVCRNYHLSDARYIPTKAGYLWLATERAKDKAARG